MPILTYSHWVNALKIPLWICVTVHRWVFYWDGGWSNPCSSHPKLHTDNWVTQQHSPKTALEFASYWQPQNCTHVSRATRRSTVLTSSRSSTPTLETRKMGQTHAASSGWAPEKVSFQWRPINPYGTLRDQWGTPVLSLLAPKIKLVLHPLKHRPCRLCLQEPGHVCAGPATSSHNLHFQSSWSRVSSGLAAMEQNEVSCPHKACDPYIMTTKHYETQA